MGLTEEIANIKLDFGMGCLTIGKHYAELIHQIYLKHGWVQLAENQELPENDWENEDMKRGWDIALKDMLTLKDGEVWKKVKVE